ncbi:MAG: hypothetical protein OIF51_09765 [Cellvibrionaceae bacterium]|nr:hypothetical protein [Cellvibrionaceae bacterium]
MTDTEAEPSFQARAFEEVVRLGKWILSRRKLTRSDVFSNEIEPLIDELDAVHADFLEALHSMKTGIGEVLAVRDRKTNNIPESIKGQIDSCREVSEKLNAGRLMRRKLYEKCLARYVDLRTNTPDLVAKRAFLMPADLELIAKFYDALMAYFTNDASVYDHDMRTRITIVKDLLDTSILDGISDESASRLEEQLAQISLMEQSFSENWAEATKFRFQLESRLS